MKILLSIIMIVGLVILTLCVGMLSGCFVVCPDSESDSYFERTVELLSAGDLKAAEDLSIVLSGSEIETQLETASKCLVGRKMINYKKISSEITKRRGSYGALTQEDATYEMTLDDGTVFIVHTFYSDGLGTKGFSNFELQLD